MELVRANKSGERAPSGVPLTQLQGQAGVWQVASQLALRGFHPHFPGVDYGYDLQIDAGIRIQVKCSHLSFRPASKAYREQGAYWFKLGKCPRVSGNNTIRKRSSQVFSEKCDFVILWGIEQNRFWICPATLLDSHQLVCVGPDVWHHKLDSDEIRRLHDDGLTQYEIADKLGVDQMTISRRMRGQFLEAKRTISAQVRDCENAWSSISAYLETLSEASEAAATPATV